MRRIREASSLAHAAIAYNCRVCAGARDERRYNDGTVCAHAKKARRNLLIGIFCIAIVYTLLEGV